MSNKIQELTDIIYNEGVVKGQAEADRIIAEADAEAKKIIKHAQTQADNIVQKAKESAQEFSDNTKKELKLYASQALNALKSEVATMITDRIVKENVSKLVADKEFLYQFILQMALQWTERESIVLTTSDADSLKSYFMANAKSLLDSGAVTIKQVNGIETLFTISPADGSYKMVFGDEEFENYFKSFLRPQIVDTLFNQ